MNHAETAAKLIALAADEGTSMEERRTAAFQAAQIMHKHVVVPSHKVSRSFDEEFERLHFLANLKGTYLHASGKVYEFLAEKFEHPATPVAGRAELNRLCYALAQIAGDVVLGMPNLDANLAQVKECLGVVVAAFDDWGSRQPPPDPGEVRAAVMALFDGAEPPESHLNTMAAAVHAPVPAVQAALDKLVADGFIRVKGSRYSKVKRRPKPKNPPADPRQTAMFDEVSP